MKRISGIFIATFFIASFLGVRGQNACVKEFLDSVDGKAYFLHDGRYHATFTFSDQSMSAPVVYEGTCYFSKDSAVYGGVADFIVFEHDTVPLFAYMDKHFYKFDAVKKQYTKAYLRRDDYFAKSSYDFQHFLAVGYLLNSNQRPFDNDLPGTVDSSYCDCMYAGYMIQNVLRSQQYGEEHIKIYYKISRTINSDTIKVSSSAIFPGRTMSRGWVMDSMRPIANGEAFVRGWINALEHQYTEMPTKDLDDPNWVPPAPPAQPGEKLIADTIPQSSLTTIDGAPATLSNSGKLVMLDFWWTRSPTGLKSLADVESLNKKYAAKGVSIVGINPYDLDMDVVREALQKQTLSYPIYMDRDAALAKLLGVYLFPTIILADPVSKKILFTHVGSTDLSDVDKAIKQQLGLN